jgi:hypothetical protein
MRKKIIILFILGAVLFLPTLVTADCVDLKNFTSWILESEHKVIFYVGVKPIARLEVQDCRIQPSSSIRLIQSYVCDSDEIIIDGYKCGIISVKILF